MDNQIQITVIKNPFDPSGSRYTKIVDYKDGRSIAECLLEFYPVARPNIDIIASRNGAIVDNPKDILTRPGDSLVLCPVFHGGGGGKNPLKMVAALVVAVVAAYTGQWYAVGAGFTTTTAAGVTTLTTTGTMVAAGVSTAITMAGGMIINAAFGSIGPSGSSATNMAENSPTYSWGAGANPYQEGGTVPVLFGKMRVKPTVISSYTRSTNDQQFLSILYLVAEGKISSISNVRVNGNPYTNYDSISLKTRLGENEQSVISFFGDTYSDMGVNSKLATDLSWTTITTPGDSADGLVIVLSCPSGLWYASDTGGLEKVTVSCEVQSRRQQIDNAWTSWNSWGIYSISGSDYSTIRKTIRKDNLTQGKYEIRVKYTSAPPTGSRYGSDVYLDYMQEIFYDDFTYPNTALLGVEALATDQLSGSMPVVDCLVERSTILINGSEKPASNPAWASWAILTDKLSGIGISKSKLVYSEFEEWANWCTEKGIYCGLYVDSTMSAPSALSMLNQLGRGRVIQRGNKYGVIIDKPSDPIQMFTVGNIIADSFEETWMNLEDRANVISVEYWDEEDDYTRKTFQVRTDPLNSSDEDIETTVTLTGCTNKDVAFKHAKYLLNCNKYLLRTVSITVDVDAIACQPGDVILVQHDVPLWGYGGRVQNYDSGNITIDRTIEMPLSAGSYRIALRHSIDDSLEELTLANGEETTDIVTAASAWAIDPEAGDVYSIGEAGTVIKPFRVVSITKSSDLACKITCLEYFDEIYEDDGEIPEITDFSHLTSTANLKGKTTIRELEGLEKKVLCLSWSGSALQWIIYKRLLGSNAPWEMLGTTHAPRYDVFNLQDNRYYELNVSHTGNPSGGRVAIVNFPGDASPAGLELVFMSDGITKTTIKDGEDIYIIGE